jgi:hypothetical protein
VRLLLFLLIAGAIATLPFAFLRQPWAVKLSRRIRFLFVLYTIVIVVSALVALVFRWDAFYG